MSSVNFWDFGEIPNNPGQRKLTFNGITIYVEKKMQRNAKLTEWATLCVDFSKRNGLEILYTNSANPKLVGI